MVECQICHEPFENLKYLQPHLRKHSISSREYYDKYLRKPEEGLCTVCGRETTFLSITKGYSRHCSAECSCRDPESVEKRNRSLTKEKRKMAGQKMLRTKLEKNN